MPKLLFLVTNDSYFCSHRLNLGIAAMRAGFEVAVATKCDTAYQKISNAGIKVFPLQHLKRGSINPFAQLRAIWEIYQIYSRYKPDVTHHVAIKPVILGSLAAMLCHIPRVINALGGLGYIFTESAETDSKPQNNNIKKTILRSIICPLFRFIFSRKNSTLILQNEDDLQTLIKLRCINVNQQIMPSKPNQPNSVAIIRGAGVDVNAFPLTALPPHSPIIIACVSRMLWDKGIGELIEAGKLLQEKNYAIQIRLYGMPDPENHGTISEEQLNNWHNDTTVIWKKHCDDVAAAYADCHIAVLASSYREGLPKSLLEAASCGRPIVTTDAPGCREVVRNGENGFLVPVKDSAALAEALRRLIEDETLRVQMGQAGRKRVEEHFVDSIINKQTIALY